LLGVTPMISISRAAFLGAVLATFALAIGCTDETSPPAEETNAAPAASVEAEPPEARLEGLYQSTSYDGTYALIQFVDDTHYLGWRVCQSMTKDSPTLASCFESGTYVQTRTTLQMTDTLTGKKTSFHYNFISPPSGSIVPQDEGLVSHDTELVQRGVQLLNDENGKKEEIQPVSKWKGKACRAACWGLGGLGCAAISVACGGASAITVGGLAIPCVVAIPAVCTAAGAGASVCSDWCTDEFG
jgi:hypothetical protein